MQVIPAMLLHVFHTTHASVGTIAIVASTATLRRRNRSPGAAAGPADLRDGVGWKTEGAPAEV